MSHVYFIGWTAPKTGRERQAGELFGSVINYFTQQQQQGHFQSFQPVFLRPHGGDLSGFVLVVGEEDKLQNVFTSDEWMKLQMQVGYVLDGFGVVPGFTGDTLMQWMGEWQKMVQQG